MEKKEYKIDRVEIIDDHTAIRINFENGKVYEIPWDFILYHFEPEYQYHHNDKNVSMA